VKNDVSNPKNRTDIMISDNEIRKWFNRHSNFRDDKGAEI